MENGKVNVPGFEPMENYSFPYNLNKPDAELKLPGYLEEISGITYYKKDKFACVQDEKAIIYVLKREEVLDVSKYKFGKDGDYEDIAIVDNTAYVLRNDGSIFRVKDFTSEEKKIKKYIAFTCCCQSFRLKHL